MVIYQVPKLYTIIWQDYYEKWKKLSWGLPQDGRANFWGRKTVSCTVLYLFLVSDRQMVDSSCQKNIFIYCIAAYGVHI
jgi:hypothetical protein